jgi:hypothetical protein
MPEGDANGASLGAGFGGKRGGMGAGGRRPVARDPSPGGLSGRQNIYLGRLEWTGGNIYMCHVDIYPWTFRVKVTTRNPKIYI